MSEWGNRSGVSEAEKCDFEESQGSISYPNACRENGNDDCVFCEVGTVKTNHDKDEHEHDNVDDVEDFISELAQKEGCGEDDEHGETGYPSHDVGSLEKVSELFAFGPSVDVHDGVEESPKDSTIACDLMETVQTLVGVGCEECEGCVFEG